MENTIIPINISPEKKMQADVNPLRFRCQYELAQYIKGTTSSDGEYNSPVQSTAEASLMRNLWKNITQSPREEDKKLANDIAEYIMLLDFKVYWEKLQSQQASYYALQKSRLQQHILEQVKCGDDGKSSGSIPPTQDRSRDAKDLLRDMYAEKHAPSGPPSPLSPPPPPPPS